MATPFDGHDLRRLQPGVQQGFDPARTGLVAVTRSGVELPSDAVDVVWRPEDVVAAGRHAMMIRDATEADWAAIWPFVHEIIDQGRTYCLEPDTSSQEAYEMWFLPPPGRTVVAVDEAGAILGTAHWGPNRQGPGAHVANASFMVDAAHAGKGVGRLLAEQAVAGAGAEGYRSMQFNAVVESNTRAVALWRSLGFQVLTTVPEAFHHPVHGYVGLLIMYRSLTGTIPSRAAAPAV